MDALLNLVGSWRDTFKRVLSSDPMIIRNLNIINNLYKEKKIYPEQKNIFKAFEECPYKELRVIIILQDPYHDGSATGIPTANSKDKKKLSPSLRIIKDTVSKTIYKGQDFDFDTTLVSWAKQGILLLNTALTVEEGKPKSHSILWDAFTKNLLLDISDTNCGLIYCFWGKQAIDYSQYINKDSNIILYAVHPVYASYRGISWECDHFQQINSYLTNFNNLLIRW
jgi:uracil-DNA glycosylase